MAMVVSTSVCACSAGGWTARHRYQEHLNTLSFSSSTWPGTSLKDNGSKRSNCSIPVAAMPLLSLAAEFTQQKVETIYNDWMIDEMTLKNIYLCFSLFFVWGCCVFGSMKDPFYDSDLYRGEGGDGSGHWLYQKEEDEEVKAREELAREIEERVGELRESKEAKELV
ncbi:hypothetical protein GOP47_0025431 [Adiantum capillus-veneris]|uniref:Uncharacterized protein n=1 Tax=Adiantum capillus-veneris TaxID=13818 RepID=A0A9D4U0Y7_ADICA|nr:hypothetical protein GOP47_0025431 [Adiantum capillus-veneris]